MGIAQALTKVTTSGTNGPDEYIYGALGTTKSMQWTGMRRNGGHGKTLFTVRAAGTDLDGADGNNKS